MENVASEDQQEVETEEQKFEGPVERFSDSGNIYYDIGRNRRIQLNKVGKNLVVSIREYVKGKNGKMRPGKKGINLKGDEWKNLLKLANEFEFDA